VVEEVVPTSEFVSEEPVAPPPGEGGEYIRNTALMTVGTSLSRLTGFLRILVAAAALGVSVSALADTYNRANTTPNILYELALGGILTSVFVPVFVEWMKQHGRDEAWVVADRVLTFTAVSLSALAILGAIFAPWIIRLYTSGSQAADRQQQLDVGTYLLRWFMPQIVFYGIGAVAGGLLNANRRFAAPMFAPILNNLIVIATFGIYLAMLHGGTPSVTLITGPEKLVLGAGTTLGVIAMTAALWPSLRRCGYRWHLHTDWNHPALRRLGRLSIWVAVYVVANQVALFIIIILAGSVQGGFTAYSYAFVVFALPYAIFVVSVITALLPGMSAAWTERDPAGLLRLFSRGTRDTIVLIVPASLALIALATPICKLIFEHLHVDASDVELIAHTLQGFAAGLLFFCIFQLLTRTFYSMQDTRTPALVNVAAAVVNVGADVLFMKGFGWGIPGLALGQTVSYVFGTIVLTAIVRGRIHGLDGRHVATTFLRVLLPSLLGVGAAYAVTVPWNPTGTAGQLLEMGAAVVAGVLVFLATALIFRVTEVEEVSKALRARRGGSG
jgi:putative peptidoglycan lipid II flippase